MSELELIQTLSLIIARAAQIDSLHWWEDESLTQTGAFLFERLFPVSPVAQARSLAIKAAQARHEETFRGDDALHLYHRDFLVRADGKRARYDLDEIPHPEAPIKSMDALRAHLLECLGQPPEAKFASPAHNGRLLVELDPDATRQDMARALAWGYLHGAPGKPVYPYLQKSTHT